MTLVLGYSSVLAAAAVAYVEYTVGFKPGFNLMAGGFVVYLIISAIYYYWTVTVQKGASYIGEKGSQRVGYDLISIVWTKLTLQIYIKTKAQKTPDYTLTAKITDKHGKELSEKEIVSQYNEWFDTRGFLVQSKLNDFVKQALPENDKKAQ